jgi:hypothetical protein
LKWKDAKNKKKTAHTQIVQHTIVYTHCLLCQDQKRQVQLQRGGWLRKMRVERTRLSLYYNNCRKQKE